jgi:hypothetical protein
MNLLVFLLVFYTPENLGRVGGNMLCIFPLYFCPVYCPVLITLFGLPTPCASGWDYLSNLFSCTCLVLRYATRVSIFIEIFEPNSVICLLYIFPLIFPIFLRFILILSELFYCIGCRHPDTLTPWVVTPQHPGWHILVTPWHPDTLAVWTPWVSDTLRHPTTQGVQGVRHPEIVCPISCPI